MPEINFSGIFKMKTCKLPRNFIAAVFILCCFLVFTSKSYAVEHTEGVDKKKGFCHSAMVAIGNYFNDIKNTKGRSLILQHVDPNSQKIVPQYVRGVFTPADPTNFNFVNKGVQALPNALMKKITKGEDLELHPLKALVDQQIQPRTQRLTKNWKGGPFKIAGTAMFGLSLATFTGVLTGLDSIADRGQQNHAMAQFQKNAPYYNHMYKDDITFSPMREAMAGHETEMSDKFKLVAEARLREIQLEYFDYISSDTFIKKYDADRDKTNLELLYQRTWGELYFKDIRTLLLQGVPTGSPQFIYPKNFEAKVSMDQIDLLMKNRHFTLARYEQIRKFSSSNKSLDELSRQEDIKFFMAQDNAWPFVEQVYSLYKAGRITREAMEHTLEKDAQLEERLNSYKILGIQQRYEQNGKFTDTPLDMSIERALLLHDSTGH